MQDFKHDVGPSDHSEGAPTWDHPEPLRPDSHGLPTCAAPSGGIPSVSAKPSKETRGTERGALAFPQPRLGPALGVMQCAKPDTPRLGQDHTALCPGVGASVFKETHLPVSCPAVQTWMVKNNNNNDDDRYENGNKTGERSTISHDSGVSGRHFGVTR